MQAAMTPSPSAAFRALSNPDARLPLPAYLTTTTSFNKHDELAAAIRDNTAACGIDFDSLTHINLAWPQKDPRTDHYNMAAPIAKQAQAALQKLFPEKDILRADALYETVKLNRSDDPSIFKALTERQVYAVDPALQTTNLPFLSPDGAHGEIFVIADWNSVQGTTFAMLNSFIAHNGGHVVAAVTPSLAPANHLRQQDSNGGLRAPGVPLQGHIPLLASSFREAAEGHVDYTPAECVALFDHALHAKGMSLTALTHGEADIIFWNLRRPDTTFPGFVEKLGMPEAAQHAYVDRLRLNR